MTVPAMVATATPASYRSPERYSEENQRREALMQRAQEGETDARNDVVLSLQHYIDYWAGRFARAYSWASPRLEEADLVGVGNLALVELFEQAMTCENPCAILAARAKFAMWNHCKRYASLIATPDHADPVQIESLDAPLSTTEEGDAPTLADLVAAPSLEANEPGHVSTSAEDVERAVALLTPTQQRVLQRRFGLGEHAAETLEHISQNFDGAGRQVHIGTVHRIRVDACKRLEGILLQATAPLSAGAYTRTQALAALGLKRGGSHFTRLLQQQHIQPLARGLYPKAAIDALAQHRPRKERHAHA